MFDFWRFTDLIDTKAEVWFSKIRTDFWFTFFDKFTTLGTIVSGLIFLSSISIILFFRKNNNLILPMWGGYFFSECSTWMLKYIIARPRPEVVKGVFESNPSFPSGHSTSVTFIATFSFYLILTLIKSRVKRGGALILCGFIWFLVLFSRMYLNLHYLSDVIAGMFVGFVWGFIACMVASRTQLTTKYHL